MWDNKVKNRENFSTRNFSMLKWFLSCFTDEIVILHIANKNSGFWDYFETLVDPKKQLRSFTANKIWFSGIILRKTVGPGGIIEKSKTYYIYYTKTTTIKLFFLNYSIYCSKFIYLLAVKFNFLLRSREEVLKLLLTNWHYPWSVDFRLETYDGTKNIYYWFELRDLVARGLVVMEFAS